jgi:hypothetical protein
MDVNSSRYGTGLFHVSFASTNHSKQFQFEQQHKQQTTPTILHFTLTIVRIDHRPWLLAAALRSTVESSKHSFIETGFDDLTLCYLLICLLPKA